MMTFNLLEIPVMSVIQTIFKNFNNHRVKTTSISFSCKNVASKQVTVFTGHFVISPCSLLVVTIVRKSNTCGFRFTRPHRVTADQSICQSGL